MICWKYWKIVNLMCFSLWLFWGYSIAMISKQKYRYMYNMRNDILADVVQYIPTHLIGRGHIDI